MFIYTPLYVQLSFNTPLGHIHSLRHNQYVRNHSLLVRNRSRMHHSHHCSRNRSRSRNRNHHTHHTHRTAGIRWVGTDNSQRKHQGCKIHHTNRTLFRKYFEFTFFYTV